MSAVFVVLPSLKRAMVQVLALFLPCPQNLPRPSVRAFVVAHEAAQCFGRKAKIKVQTLFWSFETFLSVHRGWSAFPALRGGGLLRCNLFFFLTASFGDDFTRIPASTRIFWTCAAKLALKTLQNRIS